MISASSVDFSDISEALDGVHRYGSYLSALCPFHDDTRPSFFVYSDRYRCLSCGATGETSKLLYRLGKVARPAFVSTQAQGSADNPFTRWSKERSLSQTLRLGWQTINQNPDLGRYIVKERGIQEPYRSKLGIGYMEDWYTIPIRSRTGRIVSAVARKGRSNTSLNKYVIPNGTDPHLLYVPNWSNVARARYLILCFGILDAIVLAICGQPAASTLTGKNLSKAALASFRVPILIIPDQREEADGLKLASTLGWRGSLVRVDWPEGCKDINDIWVRDPALCRKFVEGIAHGVTRSLGDQHWPDPDQEAVAYGSAQ